VTRLRKIMLEELQRRNYSAITTRNYLRVVADFAKHFGKSPDKLGLVGEQERAIVGEQVLTSRAALQQLNRQSCCFGRACDPFNSPSERRFHGTLAWID
jgi:integrase/recombinase XerD